MEDYLRMVKVPSTSPSNIKDRRSGPQQCQPNEKPKHEENSEKVFIVYKFIQTPLEAIIAGM